VTGGSASGLWPVAPVDVSIGIAPTVLMGLRRHQPVGHSDAGHTIVELPAAGLVYVQDTLCTGSVIWLSDFLEIVGLSISVSLAATAIAAMVGLPVGAMLAIFHFRGRRLIIVLVNAFLGLPPVVVGLVLYLALSRSGPLGSLALLFTPTAMVIAQTILAIPIITALVHRAGERAWARYGDELRSDGATRLQAVPQILMIIRAELVTAVLAGFGRTVSEVGAVILVGGNIRGLTRTMTTTIALQTSQGDLSLALALGAVLVGISISISATVFALAGRARTAGSDEI
jgi:tungstate transport system permease protein